MRLFKRENGIWYVEFERGKKRSLRTRDKREAERLFKELQRELLKGKFILLEKQEKITLKQLIDEYLKWSENTKALETYKKEKWVFEQFLEFVGDKPVRTISVRHCERYLLFLKQKGRAIPGINIDYRHLKALFNKAKEWGYIKENPWSKVKPFKEPYKPPQYLKEEEVKLVLTTLEKEDPDFAIFVRFCLETGCRRNEALYLDWKDVNLQAEQIYIKGKGGKIRIIPISSTLKELLIKLKPKKEGRVFPSWHPSTVSHKWNKLMKKLGLKYKFHDLRHTTASWLAIRGVPLQFIQELLGHSDLRVTQIYAHLNPQAIKEALEGTFGEVFSSAPKTHPVRLRVVK